MPADTVDHFVPRAFLKKVENFVNHTTLIKQKLLPACRECNSTAGDRVFFTIGQKRRYIQNQYKIKYAKILDSPHWRDDELDELGYNLRSHIEHNMYKYKIIKQRLRWPAH